MKLLTPPLALLLAASLGAQDPARPETDRRVAELERRLDLLSRELEAQRLGTAPPEPAEARPGLGPAASKVYAGRGLSIGGYGEFLYEGRKGTLQDGTGGVGEKRLDALRLVLYTGFKFTDRIVFNSEVEFEHGGYSDDLPAGEVVVEFAYLDFLVDRAFNVRAGQVLIPLGFINEQHEPTTFLGARRPMVERSILPATWHENGIGVHGDLPGGVSYRAYLVNGLRGDRFDAGGIRGGRQAGKEANAQSLAWTGRVDWSPTPGLQVGAGLYTGNSNQTGTGVALPTRVAEVHGEFRARGLQVRGLFARTRLGEAGVAAFDPGDPARAAGTEQFGGYLEAGFEVLRTGSWSAVPFLRWERLNTQQRVVPGVVAPGSGDQTVLTAGVQVKPIPQVVLKADVQRITNRARTGQSQFNLGLGHVF